MADFYGCLESSSFRVRDRELFLADPQVQEIQAHASTDGFFREEDGYFAFGWYGQYPSMVLEIRDNEEGEPVELDIADVIRRHIFPGDVCQIGISGNEKLRYIGGPICWVTSKGTAELSAETRWSDKLREADLVRLAAEFNKRAIEAAA